MKKKDAIPVKALEELREMLEESRNWQVPVKNNQTFVLDQTAYSYWQATETGIFLIGAIVSSSILIWHRIKVTNEKTNGVVLAGNETYLKAIYEAILERISFYNFDQGFWGSPIITGPKIILPYYYKKKLPPKLIFDILCLRLRESLVKSGILLSELSLMQIKVGGQVVQQFPIALDSILAEANRELAVKKNQGMFIQ